MSAEYPKLSVTFADNGEDRTEEVQTQFADMVRFDLLRQRFNFPARSDAEFVFMGVVSYAALVRTGKVPATVKPETFLEHIIMAEPLEDPEDPEEAAEFPAE